MMVEINLIDIKHELSDVPVHQWDFVEVSDTIRVFHRKLENGGFIFNAIENVGGTCTKEYEEDHWFAGDCFARCLYEGTAHWDGIRHLYMGSEATDNLGYHYCADIQEHIKTLEAILKLEKQYCPEKPQE